MLASACSSSTRTDPSAAGSTASEPAAADPSQAPAEPTPIPNPTQTPVVPTAVAPTAAPPTSEPASAAAPETGGFTVDWNSCAVGECGELRVPLDWDDPDGPTVAIDVARIPAESPENRIGSLLLNFGGPGGTGTDLLGSFGQSFPAAVRERFDIVTWDPRGTAGETVLECERPAPETDDILYSDVDGLADDADLELLRRPRLSGCTAIFGLLDNIGSVTTTRDMDAIRSALGDDELNYLGYSYGTQLGWMYATLFPDRVRAMVLDAPVRPGAHSPEGWLLQMEAFDEQFERLDELCDVASDCAVAEEGMAETFERLRSELRSEPLELEDGDELTEADLMNAVITALYSGPLSLGSTLSIGLDNLDNGDGLLIAALGEQNFSQYTYQAVTCADGVGINSPVEAEAYIAARFARGETFHPSPDIVMCHEWEARVQPIPEPDVQLAVPALVIATTEDPATPYEAALQFIEEVNDTVLLTHIGGGHAVVTGNACVDDHVSTYLVTLKLPPADAVCAESRAVIGVGFDGDGDRSAPGVAVTVVGDQSPAEEAGIVVGDILLSVDGQEINQFSDLPLVEAGEPVDVGIERDGEVLTFSLIPEAADWTG